MNIQKFRHTSRNVESCTRSNYFIGTSEINSSKCKIISFYLFRLESDSFGISYLLPRSTFFYKRTFLLVNCKMFIYKVDLGSNWEKVRFGSLEIDTWFKLLILLKIDQCQSVFLDPEKGRKYEL